MNSAQVWTALAMAFTLFSWLLLQMRALERRFMDLDRRVSDGFVDVARQLGDVNGQLAEVRADLRIHQQRHH